MYPKKFAAALIASSFILGGNAMAGTNVAKTPLEAFLWLASGIKFSPKATK